MLNIKIQSKHYFLCFFFLFVLWAALQHLYIPLLFFLFIFLSGLDESILEECLQYLEKQLESSQVRKAMEEFFSFRYCLC